MIFTPGQPGWLDNLDAGLALQPKSCKGYTVGDNTHKDVSRYPWRMDDEKVAYKGYEKISPTFRQYGVNNVYGDVGQLFATTLVAEPNVCAALMGTDQGARRRSRLLGHRRAMDRRAQWQIEACAG